MVKSKLKANFKNNSLVYGAWTASSDTIIAELFAKILKPDFVAIDLEHSTITLESCKNLFLAIQSCGCNAIPRLASHDKVEIARLLDAGADGIIVPNVNNVQQLNNIIQAMKYPPIGQRGYGISRAHGYGSNFKEYTSTWNESSILIIIIESIEGIDNIEYLVNNNAVDGILIGEYDLSGSLNIPGATNNSKVQQAVDKVFQSCKKYNKSCGVLLNEVNQSTLEKAKQKADFIVLSTDILVLSQWAQMVNNFIYP